MVLQFYELPRILDSDCSDFWAEKAHSEGTGFHSPSSEPSELQQPQASSTRELPSSHVHTPLWTQRHSRKAARHSRPKPALHTQQGSSLTVSSPALPTNGQWARPYIPTASLRTRAPI